MQLSNLKVPKGARKVGKRLGKGEGSGLGKTSGRGGKGQTARAGGGVRPGFEGGQMPLYRRLPKYGFTSRKKAQGLNQYDVVNLSVLEKFDAGTEITPESLYDRGYGRHGRTKAGLKILGTGKLTKRLTVRAHAFSESARSAIEALGGKVELITRASQATGSESKTAE
jgi:large subunit ribosomal protein L15